jgi:methylated-DNA-[protein]-cysteine S-methyltransferase
MSETIYVREAGPTPIGPVWLGCTERGLAALEIGGELAAFIEALEKRSYAPSFEASALADEAARQVVDYLEGKRYDFDLPLDWSRMGAFQVQALRATLAVPYGQVTTYGALAAQLGRPRAARAVGRAEATNPIPLVIPCHRVLGTDGKLHGYGTGNGLETKTWLLQLERGRA